MRQLSLEYALLCPGFLPEWERQQLEVLFGNGVKSKL